MLFERDQMKKEWKLLEKRESRFLNKQKEEVNSVLNKKLETVVPKKLQTTLNAAFIKAFELVFEKGTKVIEKTYDKQQHQREYQVNTYAAGLKQNKRSLRAFSKQAGASKTKNLIVSGIEGVGLGLLGIGLPDIPLFTAVILKSIYEIALSYGFDYDTTKEQIFILQIIKTSLLHGEALITENKSMNEWITANGKPLADKETGIKQAAGALSAELLYMKFLQGLPIVGVIGGLADSVYLKRITDYAEIKYKKRFYLNRQP